MTTRVAIICGGRSSEHEISCTSAGGVLGAIDRTLYEPVVIGITKSGKWVLIPEGYELSISNGVLPVVPERGKPVSVSPEGFAVDGKSLGIEIVFPVLHGPYGEDGTIQGLLEIADIPFVGSGVLASAVAMDKSFAKSIFTAHGLAVAEGLVIRKSEWKSNKESISADVASLGYPVFVKPARGGSSRGTTKVKDASGIPAAIDAAHRHDPRAMVEVAIKGREIECAVLEVDGTPHASVLGEVRVHEPHEFYDFEAKYLDGATSFDVPASIPENLTKEIRDAAITAFVALGCEGLARVDFFLTEKNEVIINELNTMPGFTPRSVFPMLWAATGKNYQEIISELCRSALGRSQNVVR